VTPGELLALHAGILFRLDIDGRMYANNTLTFEPAPRFYLGRSVEGVVALVREDMPPHIAADLLELASSEPSHTSPHTEPRFSANYRELLEEDGPVTRTYFGPAYALPTGTWLPAGEARLLTLDDVPLFSPYFPWLKADIEAGQPAFGVVRDGAVVGQCCCARLGPKAAEAGLEVAEAYRGQGIARDCTAAWAGHISENGRTAMYSTSWENEVSQAVAAALGFEMYATDWHAT
jgi:RimJ/RimL family protein N-acetyltransferase